MDNELKLYSDRDIMALDETGNYYCKHVLAMTKESLHSKSDIAAELGYRDYCIDQLLDMLDDSARAFALSELFPSPPIEEEG